MKLEHIKIIPLPRKPKNKPIPKCGKRRFKHNRRTCQYCVDSMMYNGKKRTFWAKQDMNAV